jgi:hypothetical protein
MVRGRGSTVSDWPEVARICRLDEAVRGCAHNLCLIPSSAVFQTSTIEVVEYRNQRSTDVTILPVHDGHSILQDLPSVLEQDGQSFGSIEPYFPFEIGDTVAVPRCVPS